MKTRDLKKLKILTDVKENRLKQAEAAAILEIST